MHFNANKEELIYIDLLNFKEAYNNLYHYKLLIVRNQPLHLPGIFTPGGSLSLIRN